MGVRMGEEAGICLHGNGFKNKNYLENLKLAV